MAHPRFAVEDLPLLDDEAALFDASIDLGGTEARADSPIIISLITNP